MKAVVTLCALFMLASTGYGQTTCEFMFGLAELAASGTQVEHKTNFTGVSGDCTTQVVAKVDKTNPVQTKVDFKIDRSCTSSGQTQITGILVISANPVMISCNIDYDNPSDPTVVSDTTEIADVPALVELFQDAADATSQQFPPGTNPIADALVEEINDVIVTDPMQFIVPPGGIHPTDPLPNCTTTLVANQRIRLLMSPNFLGLCQAGQFIFQSANSGNSLRIRFENGPSGGQDLVIQSGTITVKFADGSTITLLHDNPIVVPSGNTPSDLNQVQAHIATDGHLYLEFITGPQIGPTEQCPQADFANCRRL